MSWIRSLDALDPDLVVNTGDSIAHQRAVQPFLDSLGPLLDRPGVFVYGSNDMYSPIPKNPARYLWRTSAKDNRPEKADLPWRELGAAMSAAGWLDLNNRRARLKAGHLEAEVAGVNDSHLGKDRYDEVAGPADPAAALRLGIMHTPEPRVLDQFAADGFDLLLAGHTHGGQVCVPGYGALVTNCGIDRERVSGLHRHPAITSPRPVSCRSPATANPPGCTSRPVSAPRRGPRSASAAGPRQRCSHWSPGSARLQQRSSGCGAAWQRASFGTKRPPVQIRPPRPSSQVDGSAIREDAGPLIVWPSFDRPTRSGW